MKTISIQYYKSPVGELILGTFDNQLCLCDWKYRRMRPSIDKRVQSALKATYKQENHPTNKLSIEQLSQYFKEETTSFNLPLLMIGTEFQKSVWQELINIPYGTTATYLQLSKQLQNEKAIRAVASANGANAISIIVPCHRIIGSDGSLVGYAGGLPAKKKLLQLEGSWDKNVQLGLFK